jgi:uncharacterized membrane protein YkvA (DUF1232 family)
MTDAFPRDRLLALVGRLPRYARLAVRLSRDPAVPRGRKALLVAGAAYLASPIDLVPGVIPLAGQLDDAAAVLLALRGALGGLPASAQLAHLQAVDLTKADLDEDLRTVRIAAGWLARRAGEIGWAATKAGLRGAVRLAGRAAALAARRG